MFCDRLHPLAIVFLRFIRGSRRLSLWSSVSLHGQSTYCLCSRQASGCFDFLASVIKAAMAFMYEHIVDLSGCLFSDLLGVPGRGIAGSGRHSVLKPVRRFQTVLQSGCSIWCPSGSAGRVQPRSRSPFGLRPS